MLIRTLPPLLLALSLAACSGSSLNSGGEDGGGGTDGGIDGDRTLPPGTTSPSRNSDIVRFEPVDADSGSGYVTSVAYNAANDTFEVDNLGFDGDNAYTRGTAVGSLGPFAVYEGAETYPDDITGTEIGQFLHRAIYGVSTSGKTKFAIVRTGSYVGYGFGGFIYERDGSVTLPTSGQAGYSGDYAALRDFTGKGGIEYSTGTMEVAIDFNDFNGGNAVQGAVFNRAIFDVNGNDITDQVIDALNEDNSSNLSQLPTLVFSVGPNVMDANGEMVGELHSTIINPNGAAENFETGNYYAVVAGNNAQEIVGVIVVEAEDPRYEGVTVRETGGFLLERPGVPAN